MSACVISEKIWNVLKDASPEFGPVMHGFTYSGHPVGGALGLVNIDIMEREGLVEQSAEVGGYLQKLLAERVGGHPARRRGARRGADDRGRVRCRQGRAALLRSRRPAPHRVVAAKALELGVLTRALPFIEVNSFSPPL